MRILLLPLTRRQTLFFAQRLSENEANKPSPLATWIMSKVQKTWTDWGQSKTKWKSTAVSVGNKLLDKIDWEEYALKTVNVPKTGTIEKVPVVHPGWVEGREVNEIIEGIVKRRRPIHQHYRWRWAVIIPLTFPFALVPVIPNFPLFYSVYRCWSHHKALKGGEYLDQLIQNNALHSEPSAILDKIYALKTIPKLTRQNGISDERLLISKDQFVDVAQEFKDNEIAILGKRAITQITKQLDDKIKKQKEEQRQQGETHAVTITRKEPVQGNLDDKEQ